MDKSACLSPLYPGLESLTSRHIWVRFALFSLPPRNFISWVLLFSTLWENQHQKIPQIESHLVEVSMLTFLRFQIWRAVRMIVDTGLHYTGMKRDEAIKLFVDNAWDDSDFTRKEVRRVFSAQGCLDAIVYSALTAFICQLDFYFLSSFYFLCNPLRG